VTKAGRIVLTATYQGRPVKVYEAAGPEHAAFIRSVSRHASLTDVFPDVLGLAGPFVVAAWVEARSTREKPDADVVAAILERVHTLDPDTLPRAGFDYWHDLIAPRFLRACTLIGADDVCVEIISVVSAAWDHGRRTVMHPDVSPRNLVRDPARRWVLVDNELLTVGGLPMLDLCNTAHSMRNRDQRDVLSAAAGALNWSDDIFHAVNAAWVARLLGTALVAGQLDGATELLDRFRAGESTLPFRV
jgi:hypothetical protein